MYIQASTSATAAGGGVTTASAALLVLLVEVHPGGEGEDELREIDRAVRIPVLHSTAGAVAGVVAERQLVLT